MGNYNNNPQPPSQDPSEKIFDIMIEFKLMGKSVLKEATKIECKRKALVKKVKAFIAKGDYEQARVTASEVIRQNNEKKRYRFLSGKIYIIAQKLQIVYQNKSLIEKIQSLTEKMIDVGNIMDLDNMSKFEQLFDNLDVIRIMIDKIFDNVNAGTENKKEVNQLIDQIFQQNGMKLSEDFDNIHIR